jgi:son of sevenless-like protein
MCSAHPHSITDVESHVQSTFAHPIDVWSLSEAQEKMERYAVRKRGVFLFPIEKLYHLLVKEVFGYKVDITVVQFIMAILDYVAADILKLAGNFVKNTRKNSCIIVLKDVHVSMSADPALQALFKPLQSSIIENIPGLSISDIEMVTDRSSMKYDELLRDLRENESQFIRQLNLILKVFQPVFVESQSLFPSDEVEVIFEPVADVYDLSMQLLTSIEEMIEMASEMEEGTRYPQIGFCFEEVAESDDFSVYLYYTENYQQAVVTLENIIQDPEVCGYFKKLSDCGQLPKLFKEAVQYVLPKALMEPIYHFFYYCNIMQHMSKATEDEDDHIAFESAISGTLAHKLQVERESQRFLPRRREDVGVFGRRVGYRYSMKKLIDLQARIEGWDGPDIHMCCTELVKEGPVSIAREGGRKAMKQKMERHVILLDGLVLCCKIKKAATPVAPAEYRLKEKIVIKGHVNLIDIEETDDLKFAFELREEDSGSPGIIFILQSPPEKNEWMSAITILLIRSTFDKALEKKLKQEEKLIPVLLPDPEKYKFAEPNSEDNILFEEEQGDGQVLIKAGTIYKLVERLTFNEYADPTFVRTFLMTYRSFCKPVELIDLLIERYYIPPPSYSDDYESRKDPHKREALKRFKVDYVSPVQLRVLNVLRHWVENHYYDFQQEPEVLDKLKEFVGTVKAKNMQKLVASIHRTLNKKEGRDTGGPPSTSDPVFFDPPPQTEWHLTRNKDEFHILTLHPLEFARQLTLVMSDLFKLVGVVMTS